MDRLYRLQRLIWRRFRPQTTGVKLIVTNAAGEILLIRNAYGDKAAFVLPGGGVRPFEAPRDAAARELREEVACTVRELTAFAVYGSQIEGKRDTIHLFTGATADAPRADPREVAGCGFFAMDELPGSTSPATRRRIAEFRGETEISERW